MPFKCTLSKFLNESKLVKTSMYFSKQICSEITFVSPLIAKNWRFLSINQHITYRRFSKGSTMSKSALVILAQGAEEMETVIPVDMLRRAGVTVTLAGLDGDGPVLCSRQVSLVPDKSLADALAEKPQYDVVILPGGLEGTDRLTKSSVVGTLVKEHEKNGKLVAAICAAPSSFVTHGVAEGKRVTSYPSVKEKFPDSYKYVEGERVVVDGNIVTSRGPGTAYWFGLKLIEMLVSKEKADQVEKGMMMTGY